MPDKICTHRIKIVGLGLNAPAYQALWLPLLADCQVICAAQGLLKQIEPLLCNLRNLHESRQPEALPQFLPIDAQIEALAAKLAELQRQGSKIAVLAGGDPLFYGIGSTLARYFAPEELEVYPGVSSMQEACARLALPWAGLRHISLHGRNNWQEFDNAAQAGTPICLLWDNKHSLPELAQRLIERGRDKYCLHYFAALRHFGTKLTPGNPQNGAKEHDTEQHLTFTLEEAAAITSPDLPKSDLCKTNLHQPKLYQPELRSPKLRNPGLLLLLPASSANDWPRPFLGMPDELFRHANGLITKQPVRAAALAALRLRPWHSLLDIGAGCGSLGLEACALLPNGRVYALEKQSARIADILHNRQALGAANLEVIQAEAMAALATQTGHITDTVAITQSAPDWQLSASMTISVTSDGKGQSASGLYNQPLPAARQVERIFIGGGLGGENGTKLLKAAWAYLAPGGRLVVSCVLLGSLESARRVLKQLAGRMEITSLQAGVDAALAGDIQLKALNQVFILAADKPVQ